MEPTGRTNICSILFLDIIGYSKAPDDKQFAMKGRLSEVLSEAMAPIAESERIILDTGDGAAICFMGDPEDALFVATAVMKTIQQETGAAQQHLRIGINLGPIKVITDLSGRPNVVGDGINVAQRVMSFADDNEILVSRSYYEVVARLKEGNERLFQYLGSKKDKHVRSHQVYAVHPISDDVPATVAAVQTDAAIDEFDDEANRVAEILTQSLLHTEEQRLARLIGPLAKVIVQRAAASAPSVGAFYDALSIVIHDEADRKSFLADAPVSFQTEAPTETAPADLKPDQNQPLSQQDLQVAQKRLTAIIGPLASVLVRKAAAEATDLTDLYERLAENLTNDADKRKFLAAAAQDA